MIGVAFAFVLAVLPPVVRPNPVHVAVGETIDVTVENFPSVPSNSYGAWVSYVSTSDSSIVSASGGVAPGQSSGIISVRGVKQGTATVTITSYRGYCPLCPPAPPPRVVPVADVIVTPCIPPTLTFDAQHVWIPEGESITVTAMTTGTGLGHTEWFDGEQLRGLAPSMTFTSLPIGTHRFTARVSNACGAASDEVVIDVVVPRRRTVRK